MNEVNKTLFIPLFGKAQVSKKGIILKDLKAEEIWGKEQFPMKGKAKSKWLSYNMAMRARIFDDWTQQMLRSYQQALVLQIGCGLDSRVLRVKGTYVNWLDADFPEVIKKRKSYFEETESYHMIALDASNEKQVLSLPDAEHIIVILEGVSMYLNRIQLNACLANLSNKYAHVHLLMDVYTEFAAKASKYKNPVNEVGVTKLYGIDDVNALTIGTALKMKKEYSLTPDYLVNELQGSEKAFFKLMFTGKMMKKFYRLFEFETA